MTECSRIRINQVGYTEGLPMHAVITSAEKGQLTDEAGTVLLAFEGNLKPDEASGDQVRLLRLPDLHRGEYTISCGGDKRRLRVSARPWAGVTRALLKGLYYQRCGCSLDAAHAGPWHHAACHTAECVDWTDPSRRRLVTGGWHDAGDYGKYVGPGAVTVGHLLYTHLLFPDGCDGEWNIPESGNGLPDILNEARYELEWLLKMQREDGAFYHKLTKARFAPFIMPEEDREPEYLMPVSHCATAAACACLALGFRVYQTSDADFASRMLLSARRAWAWLKAHPEFVPFVNPEGVRTGQYGEKTDADDRFWAACELFAATGEEEYRLEAEALYCAGQRLTAFGWADVGGMGALCCLFSLKESAGRILYDELRQNFLRQSEQTLALVKASGYGTALGADGYVWGSILPIMSNAMAMILHFLLTENREMRDAALLQLDYALGMNALDLCFVTGFGENQVSHPHHRPSGADGIDAPVPGLISGGPNKRFPYPSTREALGDAVPPAKYFLDETPSADTNEIAIYWNSPAIFVFAFAGSAAAQAG